MTGKHGSPEQRFQRYVEKTETCWLWTGGKNARGYGRINVGGRPILAHRVSYELYNGPVPFGMVVCHRCDNPSCVNPAHLFAASQYENMQDMTRKGRASVTKGEGCGKHILKEHQVREILASNEPPLALAKKYGVARRTIYGIKGRTRWAHVAI